MPELFLDFCQLGGNHALQLDIVCENFLNLGYFPAQILDFGYAVENVLAVKIAQLDFGNVVCLHLVDIEAGHQGGNNLLLLLGLADDADRLVDVQQNLGERFQQMELVPLFAEIKGHFPPHASGTEGNPFPEDFRHTHLPGRGIDKDIEIAFEGILKRGQSEQTVHQSVRIGSFLEVDCQLKAGQTDFIAHIRNFPDCVVLDKLNYLIHDLLQRSGVGDLENFNAVCRGIVLIACPDAHGTLPGFIHRLQLFRIVDQRAAAREVGSLDNFHQPLGGQVWFLQQGNCTVADLRQIEGADVRRHADCDAHIGRYQNIRESSREQNRFLHGGVVVVHHVHGILIDTTEYLRAERLQFYLSIPHGRGIGVGGVLLAEAALGVYEGMQE